LRLNIWVCAVISERELSGQIEDIEMARAMATAEIPVRETLAAAALGSAEQDAFYAGWQAGALATMAALEQSRPSPEAETSSPQRLASRSDLGTFAIEHDYTDRSAGRAWNRLRNRYLGVDYKHLEALTSRVWVQEYKPSDQHTQEFLDVNALHKLLAVILAPRGSYIRENDQSTFKGLGVRSLGLFADYVNVTLELQEDERLPLPPLPTWHTRSPRHSSKRQRPVAQS
jgi:hypothetical protein